MNAKEELLGKIAIIANHYGATMLAADISYSASMLWSEDDEPKPKEFKLKQSHTIAEYTDFINSLDFEYDAGYGGQELYGTVWFTDGIWMDRYEYDGSESWDIHKYPVIPAELV